MFEVIGKFQNTPRIITRRLNCSVCSSVILDTRLGGCAVFLAYLGAYNSHEDIVLSPE